MSCLWNFHPTTYHNFHQFFPLKKAFNLKKVTMTLAFELQFCYSKNSSNYRLKQKTIASAQNFRLRSFVSRLKASSMQNQKVIRQLFLPFFLMPPSRVAFCFLVQLFFNRHQLSASVAWVNKRQLFFWPPFASLFCGEWN